jgi:hypothetical protein
MEETKDRRQIKTTHLIVYRSSAINTSRRRSKRDELRDHENFLKLLDPDLLILAV